MAEQDLQELVAQLVARIDALEAEVGELRKSQEIPEDTVLAISAAVAAYLGCKAKVKAVRFSNTSWARATRERQHNRSVMHVR